MARLSPFVPFGLVLAFQAWLWPFWPVFGLSDTLYNLAICERDVMFTTEFVATVRFHCAARGTLSG